MADREIQEQDKSVMVSLDALLNAVKVRSEEQEGVQKEVDHLTKKVAAYKQALSDSNINAWKSSNEALQKEVKSSKLKLKQEQIKAGHLKTCIKDKDKQIEELKEKLSQLEEFMKAAHPDFMGLQQQEDNQATQKQFEDELSDIHEMVYNHGMVYNNDFTSANSGEITSYHPLQSTQISSPLGDQAHSSKQMPPATASKKRKAGEASLSGQY